MLLLTECSTVDMISSLRQLQCREKKKPLYVASLDLTKDFDLVSWDGLFKILLKIEGPSNLDSMMRHFHDGIKTTSSMRAAFPYYLPSKVA